MTSFARTASALVPVVALVVSAFGCSAKITTTGETCEWNGQTHEPGEQFPAGDGCNTCGCSENGEVSCTLADCADGCFYDGTFYQVGANVNPDECTSCTCESGGELACYEEECCAADDCCFDGDCGCESSPWPDCTAPDGCWYDGPYCIDESWTCGDLYCDDPCPSDPPICEQPNVPECWAEPICSDGSGWECIVFCEEGTCADRYPGGFATASELILEYCGCHPDSPCASACLDPDVGGCVFDDECRECVQGQADMNAACELSAVVSDECQSDPDCADYVTCELSEG